MNIPADLFYAQTDEWTKVEGSTATVGITDYAQDALSDVVFIEYVVSVGDTVQKGQQIATVESVKAAADINAPVSGEVVAVNEDLGNSPELVNKDPFGQAWMLRIEMSEPAETRQLMNSDGYAKYCEERSH
jgi:glycine cleavage system H protein